MAHQLFNLIVWNLLKLDLTPLRPRQMGRHFRHGQFIPSQINGLAEKLVRTEKRCGAEFSNVLERNHLELRRRPHGQVEEW